MHLFIDGVLAMDSSYTLGGGVFFLFLPEFQFSKFYFFYYLIMPKSGLGECPRRRRLYFPLP